MVVIFDLVGTLFSLEKVKNALRDRGIRSGFTELWFAMLLQSSMASMLAGKYIPFNVLAHSTLKQIFAREHVDKGHLHGVLSSLRELEPWEDADECLRTLRSDGHRLIAVMNGDAREGRRLLERSGLGKWFERILCADTGKICKPVVALYEMLFCTHFVAPYECCLVSANGWNIVSGESLGMNTLYIDRLEKQWPFPDKPSGFVISTLREAPHLISKEFGKPMEKAGSGDGLKWYGEA